MHDILPFLEQGPLYDKFETHMKTGASALAFQESHVVVPIFVCPSDPVSPKPHTFWGGIGTPTQGFSGNVVANAGSGYFNQGGVTESARLNGMFFAQSKVRMADVKDGTTNTAMLSEIVLSPDTTSHDIRGRYYNPAHGGVLFSTRIPPNTRVPDRFNWCSNAPLERAPCVWTGTDMFVSARSYHTGGVNMAMVDGSVHFVTNYIDRLVYEALGSRNGKENVGGLGL